jgi:DNA-binding CsgD family transcriptional regulator
MSLSPEQLAFIVRFIGACRNADDDAALDRLLDEVRTFVDFSSLWVGTCAPAKVTTIAACAGGAPGQALAGCEPERNAQPEAIGLVTRACLPVRENHSACLVLNGELSPVGRELLGHVVPHLLEAAARVSPGARNTADPPLTAREEEILRWLVQGKSNEVIARILGITPRTVKFHLANLYAKLGVTTRAQAAAVAVARLLP